MGTTRWRPPLGQRRTARIIAVGGADAGAGKSIVASNLAVAIAGLGPQVVLVDLDLGAPRLHTLFGVTRPVPGLQAWLDHQVDKLDGAAASTGIRNLHLVTGAPRIAGRALAADTKRELMQQLYDLDGDVVVVDVGTSNRDDLMDFFASGALRLLVAGAGPGSFERTYAFLKQAALRAARLHGPGATDVLGRFRGRLIGNHTQAAADAESFHAFSRLVRDHLGLPLPVLGCLRGSERIPESIAARRPLLARRGLDENVRAFHHMAELLMLDGVVSDEACELAGGADIQVPDGPLPADLHSYLRRYPRYPVDWAARLVFADRATDVRVLDVSYTGAAIEVFANVRIGDRAVLRLDQLQGQPSLPVEVKNVLPGLRRIGISFTEPGDVTARLVAAASDVA